MKNLYSLLLALAITATGYAQSSCDCFDRLYQLAVTRETDEEYISVMKDAISFLNADKAGQYYPSIGSAYASLKNYDSANRYYIMAAEWGCDPEVWKKYKHEIYIHLDTLRLAEIQRINRGKMDLELYGQFVKRLVIDQSVRNDELFNYGLLGDSTTSPDVKKLIVDMFTRVDSATYEFLVNTLDTYGMPNEHVLGCDPLGIMAFILHVTGDTDRRSNDLIARLEALNRSCNYVQKSQIFLFKERRKYYHERKTQGGLMGGEERYLHVEDITKADSIRFEYNHLRIKEAKQKEEQVPAGYKPKPYPPNYFCLRKYHLD